MNASIFVKVSEVEFNQDFIARVIPKIDWDCLCRAAEQLGHLEDLPKVCDDDDDDKGCRKSCSRFPCWLDLGLADLNV